MNSLKINASDAQKYGVDAALLLAMISGPAYLQKQGRVSGFSQTFNSDYPWDIRQIDGRIWYGFSDTDLKILAPAWEADYTRQLFYLLVEKGVFDTQEGSQGTHYSFRR